VAAFIELGIDKITISGGDPLTIPGLTDFLVDIRDYGIKLIKVDTVGTNLINSRSKSASASPSRPLQRLRLLVDIVDYISVPLDGWSNETAMLFRMGRHSIHDETIRLLTQIDDLNRTPNIVINTVMHTGNYEGLWQVLDEIARHRSICHWNIFQYTPTDQVSSEVNARYSIDSSAFQLSCEAILSRLETMEWAGERPSIEFRSKESRLGEYLLINSDGNAWLPDHAGNSVHLGNIYGNEINILRDWSRAANEIKASKSRNVFPELLPSQ
jgi:MoaA/NifB/PqqE/SkfB family radical SAM enzyme